MWKISFTNEGRSDIATETKLLTALSELKYGSYADIRYGTEVMESTKVRNYVVQLCIYLVDVYGDMFLNRKTNWKEVNLIEK